MYVAPPVGGGVVGGVLVATGSSPALIAAGITFATLSIALGLLLMIRERRRHTTAEVVRS